MYMCTHIPLASLYVIFARDTYIHTYIHTYMHVCIERSHVRKCLLMYVEMPTHMDKSDGRVYLPDVR